MTDINIAVTKDNIEENDILLYDRDKFKKKINIITLPTITTIPIYSKDIINSIKKIENGFYNYYIFLSVNSVDIFFKIIKNEKNQNDILKKFQRTNKENKNNIITIGPKTKKEIEKHDLNANLPGSIVTSIEDDNNILDTNNKKISDYSLNSIEEFLDDLDKSIKKEKINILMPRSSESQKSNNIVTKKYKNIILDQVFFYKTIEYDKIKESIEWDKFKKLAEQKELKYLLFTSPSTVRAFFKILITNVCREERSEQFLSNSRNEQEILNFLGIELIISIGPKTSEELRKKNIIYIESEEHTINGSLKYLLDLLHN